MKTAKSSFNSLLSKNMSKNISVKEISIKNEDEREFSTFQAQVDNVKRLLYKPKYIIDPESKYVHKWDIVILISLLFTALVTPYEVALLSTQIDALFFLNRIIDIFFLKDMVMNFFLSYWEESVVGASGMWVKDLKKIQVKYLRSWFWIDFISILPYDILGFMNASGSVSKLKIIKVIRVLRLLKMVRVLKASRIFKRLENEISISFSLQSLIKFSMMVLFGGHWLACVWVMVGLLEWGNGNNNWITGFLDLDGDGVINSPEEVNHFSLYSASLYYAIMTISSIGYGDITPQSTAERWTCICIMLCGSAVWAYVIGNASGIVATMNQDGVHFHQTMDNLNGYLHDQRCPGDLQKKMRSYFHANRHLMKTKRNQTLVQELSPELRDTVAVRSAVWVKKVPWCKGVSKDFVASLVQRMHAAVFCPEEIMPSVNHLCVISKGVASKQGSILVKGAYYGMDIILQSTFLKQKTPARALTHTELLLINKLDLVDVFFKFPKDSQIVRRYALRLAIRRAMVLISTFSKCGWKFSFGETQIPYVAPQSINQNIGEKYERFVHKLHPQLSMRLPETDVDELIISTEKQEHEEGHMSELLGNPSPNSGTSSMDHRKLEKDLIEMEIDLNEMNQNLSRCINALSILAEDIKTQQTIKALKDKGKRILHENKVLPKQGSSNNSILFIDNNTVRTETSIVKVEGNWCKPQPNDLNVIDGTKNSQLQYPTESNNRKENVDSPLEQSARTVDRSVILQKCWSDDELSISD